MGARSPRDSGGGGRRGRCAGSLYGLEDERCPGATTTPAPLHPVQCTVAPGNTWASISVPHDKQRIAPLLPDRETQDSVAERGVKGRRRLRTVGARWFGN